MLVLGRVAGEKVVIRTPEGREIVLTVVEFPRAHKVRIGFEADREVTIHRREVQDAIDHPTPREVPS